MLISACESYVLEAAAPDQFNFEKVKSRGARSLRLSFREPPKAGSETDADVTFDAIGCISKLNRSNAPEVKRGFEPESL